MSPQARPNRGCGDDNVYRTPFSFTKDLASEEVGQVPTCHGFLESTSQTGSTPDRNRYGVAVFRSAVMQSWTTMRDPGARSNSPGTHRVVLGNSPEPNPSLRSPFASSRLCENVLPGHTPQNNSIPNPPNKIPHLTPKRSRVIWSTEIGRAPVRRRQLSLSATIRVNPRPNPQASESKQNSQDRHRRNHPSFSPACNRSPSPANPTQWRRTWIVDNATQNSITQRISNLQTIFKMD